MTTAAPDDRFGPWRPGIASQIPADLLHRATVFRPEHVRTALADALELADLTGLAPAEIVAFRPERLALHELLVRVTANVSVPDGVKIEDLGISFRAITRVLLERHVGPRMPAIVAAYDEVCRALAAIVGRELDGLYAPVVSAVPARPASLLARLFGKPAPWGGFVDCFALLPDLKLSITVERPVDKLDRTCLLPLDDLDFQLSVLTKLREVM